MKRKSNNLLLLSYSHFPMNSTTSPQSFLTVMFAESRLLLWVMMLQMNQRKALQLQLFLQKRLEALRYEIDNLRAESLYNCKQKSMEQVTAKEIQNLRGVETAACITSATACPECRGQFGRGRKAVPSPALTLQWGNELHAAKGWEETPTQW